jgi:CxxC-x17-CxxC domain-containing protein
MTKVICASCKQECEIPFKPKTDKPVYCRDCYAKEGNGGRSSGRSFGGGSKVTEKDIDQINEKLNKILKALKVE